LFCCTEDTGVYGAVDVVARMVPPAVLRAVPVDVYGQQCEGDATGCRGVDFNVIYQVVSGGGRSR
jgi:hypothetical protein